MMIRNKNLVENYFISSFISGLKEETKPIVRMLKPTTWSESFELSQWQEYSLKVRSKGTRKTQKVVAEHKFGMIRSTATTAMGRNMYKVPFASTFKIPNSRVIRMILETPRKLEPKKFNIEKIMDCVSNVGKNMDWAINVSWDT